MSLRYGGLPDERYACPLTQVIDRGTRLFDIDTLGGMGDLQMAVTFARLIWSLRNIGSLCRSFHSNYLFAGHSTR